MTNRFIRSLFLGVCGVIIAAPAFSQVSNTVVNRLNRLENEIQTLNRAIYKGETPPPTTIPSVNANVSAGTEIRIQHLETDLQQLRGLIEEQGHQIKKMRDEMTRKMDDMEMRLNENGGGANISGPSFSNTPQPSGSFAPSSSAAISTTARVAPTSVTGSLGNVGTSGDSDAIALYENAFSLLKASKYETSGAEFEKFIRAYPQHDLAGNATYWLGETYYVRADYNRAAQLFAEGYQKFPDGTKAPDNLLKLGMSLSSMGNVSDACVALQQLQKSHSSAGAATVLRRAEQEISRLNCS